MKETEDKTIAPIEIKLQQQQQKEIAYQGSLNLHPGQSLWCFNMTTQTLEKIELKKEKNFDYETKDKVDHSKIIMKSDCVYVAAINKKNAAKKVMAKFGIFYSKSGVIRTDAKVEVIKQEVVINDPAERKSLDAQVEAFKAEEEAHLKMIKNESNGSE